MANEHSLVVWWEFDYDYDIEVGMITHLLVKCSENGVVEKLHRFSLEEIADPVTDDIAPWVDNFFPQLREKIISERSA